MGSVDESGVIDALRRAVTASPSDMDLRLHLAEVLLAAARRAEAVAEAAVALQQNGSDPRARDLMARALGSARSDGPTGAPLATPAAGDEEGDGPEVSRLPDSFDWSEAEREIGSSVQPPFVMAEKADETPVWDVERPRLTLADVGGMAEVKQHLEISFLAPLRNPELRRMYGKRLKGGLLMYGPPGCGKTFIARALAGELGAGFMSLGIGDVADFYRGGSERNVHEFFRVARRTAPVVVFIDELDALGQRRATHNSWNEIVNTLLVELDGADADNEGLYVLGATNQPWQVDPALRRPGRFDRTLLVLPPDVPAREAIFRHHLEQRPVEGVDLGRLASLSEGLTGADIALVCESAVEHALMDSVSTGIPRFVTMNDLLAALRGTSSSIGPWLESARNVVSFGQDDATFAQLRAYLKSVKRL
jgi:AAA+ superfamily predicted ATPase